MKSSKILIAIISAILGLTACNSTGSEIELSGLWARPGSLDGNSAVYFTITNTGSPDSLLSATCSISESVQMHRTTLNDDGTASMVKQEYVNLPQGGKVYFVPGGLHLMIMRLKTPLADGDTFPITFHFENAEDITINVPVKSP